MSEKWAILCHPDNLDLIRRFFVAAAAELGMSPIDEEIIGHEWVPKSRPRWKFPETPFVKYERSDEAWAIPLGFGRWVDDGRAVFYHMRVDDFLDTMGGFDHVRGKI